MLHAWNRAEHYRDLAEECRRLAKTRSAFPKFESYQAALSRMKDQV